MNRVFKWCVQILEDLAGWAGMTYEEVNIWIFVIIDPVGFLILLYIIYRQHKLLANFKTRKLQGV